MSTFDNTYRVYLHSGSYSMPAWAKAERHEYCEPAYTRNISVKNGKQKTALLSLLLSLVR